MRDTEGENLKVSVCFCPWPDPWPMPRLPGRDCKDQGKCGLFLALDPRLASSQSQTRKPKKHSKLAPPQFQAALSGPGRRTWFIPHFANHGANDWKSADARRRTQMTKVKTGKYPFPTSPSAMQPRSCFDIDASPSICVHRRNLRINPSRILPTRLSVLNSAVSAMSRFL